MRHGDPIQLQLSDLTARTVYDELNAETIHAAKVRLIDTLGALIGGFSGEPCRIARNFAKIYSSERGATVIGTGLKTPPDAAAFVNGTTARYVEMNDVYHWPGSSGGHPSDVVMPLLAAAESTDSSGEELIVAIVVAYEVYLRMSDAVKLKGFDCANFCCMGAASGSAKLFGLKQEEIEQSLAIATVPNNALNQTRMGHLSMWKAVAAGQSGRAGVFAAMLARAGMKGPNEPFVGKAGWCNHVAGKQISLNELGGVNSSFKILDSLIKPRASCATTISSILAAEKAAENIFQLSEIEKVIVEVYERAKFRMGTGEHHWNPDSRETADHSIPYVVAATLMDGRLTPMSFTEERIANPELRNLMRKIEVVANADFTTAYETAPVEHHTRVTVLFKDGVSISGYAGGEAGDLSKPKSDAEIEEKFISVAQDYLGKTGCEEVLATLWSLEKISNVSRIPSLFKFQ